MTSNPDPLPALSEVPQLYWFDEVGKGDVCNNCGVPRTGTYCQACGQKHLRQRLHFGQWIKACFSQVTNLDRGLLFTLLQMLVRPGEVARDFVSGKQRPYVNPLAYFFLGAGLQLVSLWLLEDFIREGVRAGFQVNPGLTNGAQVEKLEKLLGEDFSSAYASTYLSSLKQAYSYAALLFYCFPFALCLALFHRISGERFWLGETMVFSLYTIGQMLVVTSVATVIAVKTFPQAQIFVGLGLYGLIAIQAHRGFFVKGWKSMLMTLISLFISAGMFFVSILFIAIISFMMRIFISV